MNRENYPSIAGDIYGWLDLKESWILYDLAKQVAESGKIVEIGSFLGKSTVCLGEGSTNGNKAKIYSIDHHKGSKEHYRMFNLPPGSNINTLPYFRENIYKAGLQDIVKPIIAKSNHFGGAIDTEIDLLFIDGSHEYEQVKKDFDAWAPKIKADGVLAIHDVYYWPGPAYLLAEIMYYGQWKWLKSCTADTPNLAILMRNN